MQLVDCGYWDCSHLLILVRVGVPKETSQGKKAIQVSNLHLIGKWLYPGQQNLIAIEQFQWEECFL